MGLEPRATERENIKRHIVGTVVSKKSNSTTQSNTRLLFQIRNMTSESFETHKGALSNKLNKIELTVCGGMSSLM